MKKWEKKEINPTTVRQLSETFNIDLLHASILNRRSITEKEDLIFYLENDFRFTHNPFLFYEMEDVVDRIQDAQIEGEKVHVHGDRDVDGITSTTITVEALRELGLETTWSVPMGDDSYGLSRDIIDQASENQESLIITVDCGISNNDEIAYANEQGIDVIILDHHNPGEVLPEALAIINPKIQDCGYPFESLAGCGVSAKVAWALKFSKTQWYKDECCLLNIRPGNDSLILEAVRLRNLIEEDRLRETISSSTADLSKLVSFLQNQKIFVYNHKQQKKFLDQIFGSSTEVHVFDLSDEIRQSFGSLADKSLLMLKEESRAGKYKTKEYGEIDILIQLFSLLIFEKHPEIYKDYITKLDLVALGTIADLMPLKNENRILVKVGMDALMQTKRPGLRDLMVSLNLFNKQISTVDVSWQMTPVINASGRLGVPDKAVNLLLGEDAPDCSASDLIKLNKERKKLGEAVWDDVLKKAKQSYQDLDAKLVMVYHKELARGITGIIASRLVNAFKVPAIVIANIDNNLVGSSRSIAGINIKSFLGLHEEFFIDYGGHDQAAGFSLYHEKLDAFKNSVLSQVHRLKQEENNDEKLYIDAELPKKYFNLDLLKLVESFEPYGENNPALTFLVKDLKIEDMQIIGKGDHLKFLLSDGTHKWPSVYWNSAKKLDSEFSSSSRVDAVFRLGRNYFMRNSTPQLTILDMREVDRTA
jgi:single-stranded-DNA-specific exonuclease